MNDFFLATNRSLHAPITDQQIEVRQIQMKNFDTWVSHADVLKNFIQDKEHTPELLTQLFTAHAVQVISVITCVTDLDYEQLLKIAVIEEDFRQIIIAVLQVNGAYFEYEKPKRSARKTDKKVESTWFDSFQLLISAGHRPDDIMNMAYGAFDQYLKAAQKDNKNKLQYLASVIRSAHHANAKEFKKFFDELKE